MSNTEAIDSAACARLVLHIMSKRNIPLYPKNYAIWYEYVAGTNAALKQAVDELIEKEQSFTGETNEQLYLDYVAEPSEIRLRALQQEILTLLSDTQKHLSSADDASSHFQSSVNEHAQCLDKNPSLDSIPSVLRALNLDIQAMQHSTQSLQQGLKDNSREVKKLRKELDITKQEAITDPLTGLVNRKALMRSLEQATKRTIDEGEDLCLLLLDIDKFKAINDTHGHVIGDKVICCVADIMKNAIKGKDLAARYGGEEFVILLPDTPFKGAMSVAEHIRKAIERTKMVRPSDGKTIARVTISIGVAKYSAGETLEALISRADSALYHSKNVGRNRVTGEPVDSNSPD